MSVGIPRQRGDHREILTSRRLPVITHEDHPAIQIAWDDTVAYAKWADKRLPTEAEFEFAARGGLDRNRYAWGSELKPGGKWAANIWQGRFPWKNGKEDGYERTSPVRAFPANGFGLYDMGGNVWQFGKLRKIWADSIYNWGIANRVRNLRRRKRIGANTHAISLFVIAPANTRVRKTEFMTPRLMKRKYGGGGRPGNTRISALRRAEERASSRSTLISLNLHTLHLQIDRLVAA